MSIVASNWTYVKRLWDPNSQAPNKEAAYIPIAKARGFTPPRDKKQVGDKVQFGIAILGKERVIQRVFWGADHTI